MRKSKKLISSLGPDERRRMIENARSKLREAEFHLRKLATLGSSRESETSSEFQIHFSAFLVAVRSPLQILCPDEVDWGWVNKELESRPQEDRDILGTFRDLRNFSLHDGPAGTDMKIEMVPESDVPRPEPSRTSGFVHVPRLPGTPEPRVGVTTYTLRIGSTDKDAVECCRRCAEIVSELIDHREKMREW